MKVASFKAAIPATLQRAAAGMTGRELHDVLSRRGKGTNFRTLGTLLLRMTTQEAVVRRLCPARPVPGGRAEYFYSTTEKGRALVEDAQRVMAKPIPRPKHA